MNEHRSGSRPDWEELEPSEHNLWQRIAAKTSGVITPGNVVSTAGLLAVCHGLYQFTNGNKLGGALEVAGGFAADAVDGYVADWTGTKSPLGKGVDASFDKVKIGATLYALYVGDVLPLATVGVIGAQNAANTAFTMIAMQKGQEMQPEAAGKQTMWFQCGGMALAAFGYSMADPTISVDIQTTGNALAIGGTIYPGLKATMSYYNAALSPAPAVELEPELGYETEQ